MAMTFEEFFKKKKIDLSALEAGNYTLFSEFKAHFQQMGEKSFDHSKKFWFNKLRHLFPMPLPVIEEKPVIETMPTSKMEPVSDTSTLPKKGFTPRFKVGNLPRSADNNTAIEIPAEAVAEKTVIAENNIASIEEIKTEKEAELPVAKPAYKPRFNIKNLPPKNSES